MMGAADQTLQALNEVRGQEKPEDVGIGEWIWGALQGDFNQERSAGQIGFDMVVSLIPVVDTLCDLRDLFANVRQCRKDPDDKVALFFLATTVVGFFPEVGTVVKSVLRLVWVYLKPLIKNAGDFTNVSKLAAATNRACDAALPRITEYLQHSRVAQWATNGKLPDVYKFCAKVIREAGQTLSQNKLHSVLDEKLGEIKSLLKKIGHISPSNVREQVDDFLMYLDRKGQTISTAIQEFDHAIKTVLKVTAKRLDDQAWRVEIYRTNRGWVAPISETGAAKLINAKPPKWVAKYSGRMVNPPLNARSKKVKNLIAANPGHPKISESQVETFSGTNGGIRADVIEGPAKLYRIIDPSNEAAGIFWVSEAEFKSLKSRDEWRAKLGVKLEWNQNGWYVEYEVKNGESLAVWRGPVASQKLDGTDYYLEGGGEQIVFFPGVRDSMVEAMPRIDSKTGKSILDYSGNLDRRVEFLDVTGEIAPTKLRAKINDPHIRGPIETGWGAVDYTPDEAKRILLTVPL